MWFDKDIGTLFGDEIMLEVIDQIFEDIDYTDAAEDVINNSYEPIEMFGVRFMPAEIIRRLGPVLFSQIADEEKQYDIDELKRHVKDKYFENGETLQLYANIDNRMLEEFEYREEEDND